MQTRQAVAIGGAVLVAIVALYAVAGTIGIIDLRVGNSLAGSSSPAHVPPITEGAGTYIDLLAAGDQDALAERTMLTVSAESRDGTIRDYVDGLIRCADWSEARLLATTTPVSPHHGTVTVATTGGEVRLTMGYTSNGLESVPAQTWYAVLDQVGC